MKPLKAEEIRGNWANIGTRLRWPYRWIPEPEVQRLRKIAEESLPEFLCNEFQN